MTESWYETVEGSDLEQGDILFDVDVVHTIMDEPAAMSSQLDIDLATVDSIVLTQTCDIENSKAPTFLMARVLSYDDLLEAARVRGDTNIPSEKYRKLLVDGNIPNNFLLAAHDGSPALPWTVVDFRQLFTLPAKYVSKSAAQKSPRLRLMSPYREHLSQSFARYFMRVALPRTTHDFIKYKPGNIQPVI